MEIKVIYEEENKRSAAYDNGKEIGESTYSPSSKMWIIDHTFVEDGYEGQGIARKLVDTLVEKARENGMKILPLCPYASSLFKKYPDQYKDVWMK